MRPIGKILWVGTGTAIVVLVAATTSCTETAKGNENGDSGANAGLSSDFSDTLRGHVTNKYNIRDDILQYIDDTYKDRKMRADFLNFAIAQQDFIESGANREAAIRNADIVDRRLTCLYRTYGMQRSEEIKIIEAMSINTESRFRAYWKAIDLQSGRVTYAPRNPCE